MKHIEMIRTYIEHLDICEMVTLWNAYCEASNHDDDVIYPMEELEDFVATLTPVEAFRLGMMSGMFCYADRWFIYDGYENLESFDDPRRHIFEEDIATYCAQEGDDLDNDTIRSILERMAA